MNHFRSYLLGWLAIATAILVFFVLIISLSASDVAISADNSYVGGSTPTPVPTPPPLMLSVNTDPVSTTSISQGDFITISTSITNINGPEFINMAVRAELSDGLEYVTGSGTPPPSTITNTLSASTHGDAIRTMHASILTWDVGVFGIGDNFTMEFVARIGSQSDTQASAQIIVEGNQISQTSASFTFSVIPPTALEESLEPEEHAARRLYLPILLNSKAN